MPAEDLDALLRRFFGIRAIEKGKLAPKAAKAKTDGPKKDPIIKREAEREPLDLDKNPILQQWNWNSDGSLSGQVYGKEGYEDGDTMETSFVPKDTRYKTYVVTASGSTYRLG